MSVTVKLGTPLAAFILVACGQTAPRGVQYFESNPEEAERVAAKCKAGTASSDECANAELAIKLAEDRARFERFRGK